MTVHVVIWWVDGEDPKCAVHTDPDVAQALRDILVNKGWEVRVQPKEVRGI